MNYSYTDTIPVASGSLSVDLEVPDTAHTMILFAHGAGSSRLSPRNVRIADYLRSTGEFGTMLFDLLTPREDQFPDTHFDIDLLADRLVQATHWVRAQGCARDLPVAYFGASTGAAAALRSAAELPNVVRAVVCRGGRPDLACDALPRVKVPVLFVVGELDTRVLELHRSCTERIAGPTEFVIVPNATHLFEEPGTLTQVSTYTLEFLHRRLGRAA